MTETIPGQSTFGRELHELEPVLFRFALRATRDAELSRDLVQDALAAALAAAPEFAGRSKLRTWVIGILSHKITDQFRRRNVLETSDDSDLVAAPSPEDVERAAIARQELGRVEAALREIPDRERLAILLVDVEGVDRDEVCHDLDVSATHLRVLLHRGRNRLRRMLEHA